MRLFRPTCLGRCLYPEALFRIRTTEKTLSISFDDGPCIETTTGLLKILDDYKIKALFFCNGRAAEENPELVELIKRNGHVIGNHSYSHPDGWKTSVKKYIDDVESASIFTSSDLFRPPYGHLKPGQYRRLKKKYKIVFWDFMSYDFDQSFNPENLLNILVSKFRPGSIIVLHDQPWSILLPFLGQIIDGAIQRGYKFVLPQIII